MLLKLVGGLGQSRRFGEVADNAGEARELSASVCLNTPTRLLERFGCYRVRKIEGLPATQLASSFRPYHLRRRPETPEVPNDPYFSLCYLFCRSGCLQGCGIECRLTLPSSKHNDLNPRANEIEEMDKKVLLGPRRPLDLDNSLGNSVGVSGLATGAGPAFDRVMETQSSAPEVRRPHYNNFFSRTWHELPASSGAQELP